MEQLTVGAIVLGILALRGLAIITILALAYFGVRVAVRYGRRIGSN